MVSKTSSRMPPSEKKLRALSRKATSRKSRSSLPAIDFSVVFRFGRAGLYLLAAAAGSYISQLSLSPVYGDIPSSLYHDRIVNSLFILAWLLKGFLPQFKFSAWIPVLVLYTPAILHYVFRFSTEWGAINGPVFTEALTYYPALFLSVYAAATLMHQQSIILDIIPATASFALFSTARSTIPRLLWNHIGSSWVLTRCGLHHLLGGFYAILSPSILLFTATGALFHSANSNTMCVFTPALNQTLATYNHTLIARHESNTGYVSVLENFEAGYRMMRCDHSLLGGEWQHTPAGLEHLNYENFKEPIYAIFVILEAVRLVEPAPKNPKPRALAM